jgi:MYXO-CTERM domain-containing protein
MGRVLMILLVALGATAASAEVFLEYNDTRYLRDYEVARYRIDLDYGGGGTIRINILARGLDEPPRVRVRDSRKRILTNREDNGRDHILDFHYTAHETRDDTFYLDVTHKYGSQSGLMEITFQLDDTDAINPDGVIHFDKYYFDYHRPEDDDDRGCAAHTGGSGALLGVALLGFGAFWYRRRVA